MCVWIRAGEAWNGHVGAEMGPGGAWRSLRFVPWGLPQGWRRRRSAQAITTSIRPAVWHLLAALERFDRMTPDAIHGVALEIAQLSQVGLDYSSSEAKYTFTACPGETFTGLQLMCLMYAGFQRFAPQQDTALDLHEPYLAARKMHEVKKGGEACSALSGRGTRSGS